MMACAATGAAEGSWIRAERQTHGRGRQGRDWSSEAGNLFASTLVRLRPGDPPASTLALVAAVALQESVALAVPGIPVAIKWPNDLVVGDAKLSGILLERQGEAVVVGFGLNLRSAPAIPDRSTVSVADVAGASPAAGEVLSILADVFARWVGRWRTFGLGPVRERWLAHAHPVGTALRVRAGDEMLDGLFVGLDADGGLQLQTTEALRTIYAGDVFLI